MSDETKQCPFCGETIKAQAQKCKFCGKWLNEGTPEQNTEETPKTKRCPVCGEEILAIAQKCKFCGEMLNKPQNGNNYNDYGANNYNRYRPIKPLPYELQRFNWGAFCFNFTWGIYNNSYMTFWILASLLLMFIPFVGCLAPLAFSIWFGIKGNEWAWNNKDWKDVEHFNSVQIGWAKAAIIVTILVVQYLIAFAIWTFIAAAYFSNFFRY